MPLANCISANENPFALAAELSGKLLIDGVLQPAQGRGTFANINPATGAIIGQAAEGDTVDVDLAVKAAARAQKDWGRMAARERGKLLVEGARMLSQHTEELARLVTLETGKALRTESRVEASVLADVFNFYGGLGSELKGETVPFRPDMLTLPVREPLGVVGAIIPWNVPMMLMALKIAPALVAGNSVVVKSAEEAPFCVLRACQILNQVLPPGVLNILSGNGPDCGGPLVAHPDVRKVTFTGSVETGKIVYSTAALKLIPVTLELGGKSPMIVMRDADLPKAVDGAVAGMRFTRQGQSCTAASRIFVHEAIQDELIERLVARIDSMNMGDPLDEATDIGTIISREQYEKVREYIRIGESIPGKRSSVCSRLPDNPALKDGLFVRPVIFSGVSNDTRLAREEIFGPVTCIIKFESYNDAIDQANDSEYGLAATIWTQDLRTALQGAMQLEAGFVQVNQNLVVTSNLSYGGIKNSGLGKEASLEAMLENFTHKKTIILNMQ